ncbi:dicarboxylate/amino acid:cation symporter [Sphingosinicella sp. BN140058]|uniref:dicarboxylate/amino acid:cation symporter n=1 Tax=Sphingosinicella sp. BN140058 TaxID=1892855 RepID=UPI001010A8F4|nr:dicarboxylate/amino acid:cation symporter [Sphingosinicella sp. BN140058]QAY76858.1 dicarboxylate/amino acid:cation symporter [Sphingosinicella sp. BN140058]
MAAAGKPFYRTLYFQVLIGIALGILTGWLFPAFGQALKPLGDGFIKLVKMIISPVIFLTVVTGIAGMSDLKAFGRVGAKAMAYFLTFSTLALAVGLIVGNIAQPGAGLNIDPTTLDPHSVATYVGKAREQSVTGFVLHIIPDTVVSAFTSGEILQVLFVAILFGIALAMIGERGERFLVTLKTITAVVFRMVHIVMYAAPIGAFGAMAFTIGTYGIGTLANLAGLIATFYLTSLLFVVAVLGLVARFAGFSLFGLIRYIKDELLLVLGTSSSESAMPLLMEKLERAGCPKPIVGLVVPTGYSFNLDGTNIYMSLATLFIAQATNTHLSFGEQMLLMAVAILSSKGAAGVTGSGFIVLAATLSVVPSVPVAGMALILGVDRFMSECRALTNFVGNAVATIVVARWEGAVDLARLRAAFAGAGGDLTESESDALQIEGRSDVET